MYSILARSEGFDTDTYRQVFSQIVATWAGMDLALGATLSVIPALALISFFVVRTPASFAKFRLSLHIVTIIHLLILCLANRLRVHIVGEGFGIANAYDYRGRTDRIQRDLAEETPKDEEDDEHGLEEQLPARQHRLGARRRRGGTQLAAVHHASDDFVPEVSITGLADIRAGCGNCAQHKPGE